MLGPTTQRRRLRQILDREDCVTMATIFDPISARLAEQLGYEAGLMGGSLASYAVLGAPDLIVLTLTELAEQVHRCTRVSDVPLVVDGDHGYGNALSVMRTVHELDRAGAAAVTIEDTLLPRPYGSSGKPALVSFDEAVARVEAAVAARGDSDLLVLGRTSAATLNGIEDAVARFKAFEAAGVDAIFLPGPQQREQIDAISDAVKVPLLMAGAPEALCDPAYLATRRVKAWSAGHQTFSVALKALHDSMQLVRSGTLSLHLPGQASKQLLEQATGVPEYDEWTRQYLAGGA
ncbi:isocitrate lyase/PEP mutase family protein [Paraburkholderia xenovorans]|uniref:isocitrate lyase/PEP mutase family protein n=1 Tax=Paraburkholderia xenovorans TaxID=36873 RepID=UPI0020A66631|nr:isocitrate lyase/PEP mutase family protein [Paraburkholderia xenovorans]